MFPEKNDFMNLNTLHTVIQRLYNFFDKVSHGCMWDVSKNPKKLTDC